MSKSLSNFFSKIATVLWLRSMALYAALLPLLVGLTGCGAYTQANGAATVAASRNVGTPTGPIVIKK